MSTKKKATPSVLINGFPGIRTSIPMDGNLGSVTMNNFRITEEGALQKRNGFSPLHTSKDPIRAYFSTQINNIPCLFLVRGASVFMMNLKTQSAHLCGQIQSDSAPVHFFYHQGNLYLLSGTTAYILNERSIKRTIGYIPLVGRDWPNNVVGEIYEPRNILHNQARISYVINDPPSIFLHTPYTIEKIHRVIRNGVDITDTEDYYLDENFNTVNILEPKVGDRITVYFSFQNEDTTELDNLFSCQKNVLLGTTDQSRILLFDGNLPASVFCSSYVSNDHLKESQAINSLSSALYFPENCDFTVGNGQYRIQGATHNRDRILFFTQGITWVSANSDAQAKGLTAHGMLPIGCVSDKGMLQTGNDTIFIGTNTIYRWESAADGSLRAVSISRNVDHLWDANFYKRARLAFDPTHNELWVTDSEQQETWICRLDSYDWFKFTGIPADEPIWLINQMGFIHGSDIFRFVDGQNYDEDRDANQIPISASYHAELGDLASPEIKTVRQILFHGYTKGGPVLVTLSGGDLPSPLSVLFRTNEEPPTVVSQKRCRSARFRCADLTIDADASSTSTVRRLSIYTK
ncbi:MAG: hypothetical protein IKA76_01120 [Clostridia bacterium]|nr:hypothetical protein [Clostridia bacterium]